MRATGPVVCVHPSFIIKFRDYSDSYIYCMLVYGCGVSTSTGAVSLELTANVSAAVLM